MYKLLIVDDEAKIREVIKEYAEFSGYKVTEAEKQQENRKKVLQNTVNKISGLDI